jgi:hypothetical protein
MTEAIVKPTVYEALQAVAEEVGAIAKAQVNQQQKFSYRGIDDVLNAIHQPMATHGVFFAPHGYELLDMSERTTRSGAAQLHLLAVVTYRIYGPAGDFFDTQVIAEALDTSDKAASKLMSMAFKYLAFQLLSIPVAGMDDGDRETLERGTASHSAPRKTEKVPPIEELHSNLADLAAAMDSDIEKLTEKWRTNNGGITVDQFMQLPASQIAPLVRQINAYYNKNRSK